MTQSIDGHSPTTIQKYLHGMHYPAEKQDLLKQARHNHAPTEVLRTIEQLADQSYGGPQEIMKCYGRSH